MTSTSTPPSYDALLAEHGPGAFFELANLRTFTYDGLELEQDSGVENSCGGIVWESAFCLTKYLERADAFARWGRRKKKLLELGCGCGLIGLVAARAGAVTVMTDVKEVAFGACSRNVERNVAAKAFGEHAPPKVLQLDWEREDELNEVIALGPYDVVLGTDVVFSVKLVGPLLTCVERTLKKSSSSVCYVCIQRRSPDAHEEFLKQTKEMFNVRVVRELDFMEDDECELFELTWLEKDVGARRTKKKRKTGD
jgi:protein N-lysine methyltransferase METTL21D